MTRSYPVAVGDTANAGSDKVFVVKTRQVQSGLTRGNEISPTRLVRPSPHAGQAGVVSSEKLASLAGELQTPVRLVACDRVETYRTTSSRHMDQLHFGGRRPFCLACPCQGPILRGSQCCTLLASFSDAEAVTSWLTRASNKARCFVASASHRKSGCDSAAARTRLNPSLRSRAACANRRSSRKISSPRLSRCGSIKIAAGGSSAADETSDGPGCRGKSGSLMDAGCVRAWAAASAG
jgi:hypothetical protein